MNKPSTVNREMVDLQPSGIESRCTESSEAQLMADSGWTPQQVAYTDAMERYSKYQIYHNFNRCISIISVMLQLGLLAFVILQLNSIGWLKHLIAVVIAYVLADFVNGLVHLYMDHNDNYRSAVGPLIAAFHLHHHLPRYTDKPIWQVYVDETGYKVWLFVVLCALSVGVVLSYAKWQQGNDYVTHSTAVWLCVAVYFCIWSSIAEVSHFLCHNRSNVPWVARLQRMHVLLPKQHHMQHHKHDNTHYAFLNGMSDPVINWIARTWFKGYKYHADQHVLMYKALRASHGLALR